MLTKLLLMSVLALLGMPLSAHGQFTVPMHTAAASSGLTVRGTSVGASDSGSNSFVVPWPSGTQAGDFVVIQANSDWNLTLPSGWTVNNLSNAHTWNGCVISKVLTSGDISAGSVTITSAGNNDYSFIAVAFIGHLGGGVREVDLGFTGATTSVTTSGAVQVTDIGLWFGSGRQAGTTISIFRGTQIATVTGPNSQQQLNTETIASSGAQTVGYHYGLGGAGIYTAVVIVESH